MITLTPTNEQKEKALAESGMVESGVRRAWNPGSACRCCNSLLSFSVASLGHPVAGIITR